MTKQKENLTDSTAISSNGMLPVCIFFQKRGGCFVLKH